MATSVVAVKWHERTNQILLGTGKAGLEPFEAALGCCHHIALQGKSHPGRQVRRGCLLLYECTFLLAQQAWLFWMLCQGCCCHMGEDRHPEGNANGSDRSPVVNHDSFCTVAAGVLQTLPFPRPTAIGV